MPRALSPTDRLSLRGHERGMSLVEALLAASILLLFATAAMGALLYGQESTLLSGDRARAALYAEEGLEAVRNIRDASYYNLDDGTHGLAIASNQWTFSGTSDTNGIYTRQIVISSTEGKRKNITSTVAWQQNLQRTGSITLTTQLTNWLQTWGSPGKISSFNNAGTQDGLKIQVQGDYAYVVIDGGNPNFVILDITNPLTPTLIGSLNLSNAPRNLAVAGNFAYVSSTDNSRELQIIDISSPAAPVLVGSYDAPSTLDASGVFVVGTTAYLLRLSGATDEFVIINVATPSSPSLVGSLNLNANANEVVVMGNYAYVASGSDTQELQVVNITTPSTPTLVGSLNLPGTNDALTIAGFGSTVVIGRNNGTVYTVNVATPSSPSLLGTYTTSASVNDLALGNNNTYVFLATAVGSAELQVLTIAVPTSPTLFGSANLAGTLNGVAYDAVKDLVFAASTVNTEEVQIFGPF